jgi:outer membrane protein assembly factor BamB
VLLVDDVLLIQTEPGDVVLVQASPDGHQELARFAALTSKTWNNPALAGDLLLVRNDLEAACYRLAVAAGPLDPQLGR